MRRASDVEIWTYAMPSIAIAFINLPAAIVLPTFYVENTSATLAGIGLVNLLRWWFDAATDPIVGYLSDRTRSRWGRRKPWMVAGAIISSIAIFQLFRPSPEVGAYYYAFWLCGVYLGFTIFSISHMAWGSELAVDYKDRCRISTRYSIMTVIGSLLFWTLPVLLSPITGTTDIGPEVIFAIAWLFVIIMPVSALVAVWRVPQGETLAKSSPQSISQIIAGLKFNKPLWRYVIAQAIWGIGQGMYLSVIYVFMRDYLQLGDQFVWLMIWFFVVQTASMPVWGRLMGRYSKHRCWALSWAVYSLVQPVVLLLEPGKAAFIPAMLIVTVTAAVNAASYMAPMAVLGDVADYGSLKTGSNDTGNYFAIQTLLQKANMGIGAGFAFPLLALFGYEIGGDNVGLAFVGLVIVYIVVPALTSVIAAVILWNFPIDARRHGIIRRRLEQLAERRKRDAGSEAVLSSG
ncbi:MAG: GPH family glycoside/pentoside/hexuronide:cation symporter [Halieaceae bacterium]